MGNRLASKIAIVIGAGSSGPGWSNGKAAATLYAREGAVVYAVDINEAAAQETAQVIRDEGGQCFALQADASSANDVKRVVEQVMREQGRIDVLHNNVGVTEMGDVIDLPEERWHHVLDTNLTSVFLTCKHVLPYMLKQESGAIVNISSLASTQVNHYP